MFWLFKLIGTIIVIAGFAPLVKVTRMQQAVGGNIAEIPPRAKQMLAVSIGLIVVGGIVFAYDPDPPPPIASVFVHPHIQAAQYEWPPGCPDAKYQAHVGNSIPRACLQEKYLFPQWRQYGFLSTRGRNKEPYYRISNDAVEAVCPFYDSNADCSIYNIVDDVFYQ